MSHHHSHPNFMSGLLTFSQGKEARQIRNTVFIGCLVNVGLTLMKVLTGYFGNSDALMADGFHSFGDMASDIVMLAFIGLSFRKASDSFSYGYGKFETFASLLISMILLVISVGIVIEGIEAIKSYSSGIELPQPDIWTVIVVVIAMCVKEFLFRFYRLTGKQTRSMALVSSAWHHRMDALTSVATLIGVGCAHFLGQSWRILDPVVSLLIGVMILIPAIRLFVPAFLELMERSLPAEDRSAAMKTVSEVNGVRNVEYVKSRKSGPFMLFDVKVGMNPKASVEDGAVLSSSIEEALRSRFGNNILVSVITAPAK